MNHIIAPKPSNLVTNRQLPVEGDVYNICTRVKEVDPNLRIVLHEGHAKPWVVMERGIDGEERFVARYEELDARIITDLQYMLKVPFADRIKKLDKEVEEANAAHGKMSEEQFDEFAFHFRDAAIKSNLIDPMWLRSYRNVNKKGRPA